MALPDNGLFGAIAGKILTDNCTLRERPSRA